MIDLSCTFSIYRNKFFVSIERKDELILHISVTKVFRSFTNSLLGHDIKYVDIKYISI